MILSVGILAFRSGLARDQAGPAKQEAVSSDHGKTVRT